MKFDFGKVAKGFVLQWAIKIGLALLVAILYMSKDFFRAFVLEHRDTVLLKISKEEFIKKMKDSWKQSIETFTKSELNDLDSFCDGFIGVDKGLVRMIVNTVAKITFASELDDEMIEKLAGFVYDAVVHNFQLFLDKAIKGIIS